MVKIVISGVNLDSGGALTIFRESLHYLDQNYNDYKVVALVHNVDLFNMFEHIEFIEIKSAKSSYFLRFFYEYIYFFFLSLKLKPDLWLSLHDMTPNVRAKVRAVYCHNPSPFYKMSGLEKKLDKKMWLFNLFYKYIYKINIKKNNYVVVQQNWLADKFVNKYQIDANKVIVAKPELIVDRTRVIVSTLKDSERKQFFYPAFPRSFKNFELICEASQELLRRGYTNFEVVLTINGTENQYANYIVEKYRNISTLNFIGLQSREKVLEYYETSNCLIFPSKLETWGLPISEYVIYNKPMLIVDLPYAKETVGNYEQVGYFRVNDVEKLSNLMMEVLDNKVIKTVNNEVRNSYKNACSWNELFYMLVEGA